MSQNKEGSQAAVVAIERLVEIYCVDSHVSCDLIAVKNACDAISLTNRNGGLKRNLKNHPPQLLTTSHHEAN